MCEFFPPMCPKGIQCQCHAMEIHAEISSFWRMVIHHGETETPWATKPQFTDVFLPNGRGLRRANQFYLPDRFLEDCTYTYPHPLPDCLGGELGVNMLSNLIYLYTFRILEVLMCTSAHYDAQWPAPTDQIGPASVSASLEPQQVEVNRTIMYLFNIIII